MKQTVIGLMLFVLCFPQVCISSEIPRFDTVKGLFELETNSDNSDIQSSDFQVGKKEKRGDIVIPDFMDAPVIGVTFFYLDGKREENLTLVIQKLASGDEGIRKRLLQTVNEIKKSGFNWVRIMISGGLYKQYDYLFPEYAYDQDIYPLMSRNEAMKINDFLDYLRDGTDGLKIELVLSSIFVTDTNMRDKKNDAMFFESILEQIDTTGIELITLGVDIMPCNIISLILIDDTVCDENGPNDDWNDAQWVKYQLDYFYNNPIDRLRKLNYSFDTITYPTIDAFKTYLKWVSENVLSYVPVVSVSAYYRQEGATEFDYLSHYNSLLDAYTESGINKPFWLDEYGFGLKDPFTEKDAFLYFKGFLRATRCKDGVDSSLFYPSMVWAIGSDRVRDVVRPANLDYCGLFHKYDPGNSPVVSQSWDLIKWFNNTQEVCSEPIPNYQKLRTTAPVGASSLLLKW